MRGFYIVLFILVIVPLLFFVSLGKGVFSTVYEFSTFLYGDELAAHLDGWNGENLEGSSDYVPNGFFLYYFTLLVAVAFYYLIDSVRFNKMSHWGLMWLGNALIVFFVSYYFFAYLDYSKQEISADIAEQINDSHILYWGLTNAIYALLLFIIFSFSIRWWSTNCSTTPFPR